MSQATSENTAVGAQMILADRIIDGTGRTLEGGAVLVSHGKIVEVFEQIGRAHV